MKGTGNLIYLLEFLPYFYALPQKVARVLCYNLQNFECLSVHLFLPFFYALPRKVARVSCYTLQNFECPSVCPSTRQCFHHLCPLHNWHPLRYFQETSHKCKALCDDMQNTWTITLVCYFWSYCPVNIEHSHFCHVLVSALKVENLSRYHYEISHKRKAWDKMQNTKTITEVNLLFEYTVDSRYLELAYLE